MTMEIEATIPSAVTAELEVTVAATGTSDHTLLSNRDAAEQHPISAITGLQTALNAKADADDVPTTLAELTDDSTHRLVTDSEKTGWSAKYDKPSGGIGTSDLSSSVNTSLGKADSAIQPADYSPATKTSDMTQSVGKDSDGKLWTAPGSGGASVTSVNGQTGTVVLDAEDVGALPDSTTLADLTDDSTHRTVTDTEKSTWSGKADTSDIPTESTVAGWGFTKNTGTYSKPASGIPESDLESSVQTSLGLADTALQSHQSLAAYRTSAAQDTIDSGKASATDLSNHLSASNPHNITCSTISAASLTNGKVTPSEASAEAIGFNTDLTISSAHEGKFLTPYGTGSVTITIPASGITAYTEIEIFRRNDGDVTIVPASGVGLYGIGGNSSYKISDQYSGCALKMLSNSEWLITGNIEAVSS